MANRNDNDSSYFRYQGRDGDDKTSTTFLVRLQGRDSQAWKDFMDLYVPLIKYWCRRKKDVLTWPERQDILLDVLQKVSLSIAKFDHTRKERSFRGWLRRITTNRIYDYLQERNSRKDVARFYSDPDHLNISLPPRVLPEFDEANEPDDDPEREAEEDVILLKQILNRIRPEFQEKSWDVFRLLFVAEKDSSEVAETMDMKPDAVRQIRSRILKRIREEYMKLGIETDLPAKLASADRPGG